MDNSRRYICLGILEETCATMNSFNVHFHFLLQLLSYSWILELHLQQLFVWMDVCLPFFLRLV